MRCGADALAARARDELSAAGLRPMQLRVDHTSPLTSQEQAVAERAAEGWSDARIGEATGLEEREVARLLSEVYRKVGTDRSGLAKRLITPTVGLPQRPAPDPG